MISISATQLRSGLFEILRKVSRGEIVTIHLRGKEVGKIVPVSQRNWRKHLQSKPKLRGKSEKVFAPLDSFWEDYR